MIPEQKEIEIPLLEILVELGGQGKPKEIYPLGSNYGSWRITEKGFGVEKVPLYSYYERLSDFKDTIEEEVMMPITKGLK